MFYQCFDELGYFKGKFSKFSWFFGVRSIREFYKL